MIITHENENVKDILCMPDPERVIEGLRDTGYNFNTAIADIVDNAIAAFATKVEIIVDRNPAGNIKVIIADNGIGMDEDGLINAMTYGSKAREEAGSLGKFGLGLKTASTAFCRSLSVITRGQGNSAVYKAQWDLDYIADVHEWKLKCPDILEEELEILNNITDGKSGTLVVWDKIDRLLKNYKSKGSEKNAFNRTIEELQFHLSMVYQRFLDKNDTRAANVSIMLNETEIKAWDPFVVTEPQTELVAEQPISLEMPDGSESECLLRAFIIPRGDEFSTTAAKVGARVSSDMQGFYVYRENRLIHSGDWLGMFAKEPHLTLLRVEFSFDHRLDDAFNVDIKKSRILLAEEIFDYIKNSFIAAPRRAADERYRKGTASKVSGKEKSVDAHSASNRNIDEKAKAVEQAKITVKSDDEVEVKNKYGAFTHKIKIVSETKPDQYRVIPADEIPYNQLWEPCIAEGKHAVRINKSHPYYSKVYYPVLEQKVMVTGMDALLWALAEAEHATVNEETLEHYEDLRLQVSRILSKLVADLPEPDIEEENE